MQQAVNKTPEQLVAEGHTPMMAQYHATKAEAPDCLLFYRMGDFYELFFDDAVQAAKILDIALTKRGATQGAEIPMCGVPAHAYEPYLAKLIRAGCKVAICDQLETPEQAKKRGGYKALVRREITRIVTAGTLTEDHLLTGSAPNYLAALAEIGGQMGCAWVDVSTGDFLIQALAADDIATTLNRINPSEVIYPDKLQDKMAAYISADALTPLPASLFSSDNAQTRLEKLFGVGTLESFGAFSRAEIAAAGALIDYIDRTQKGRYPYLARPRQMLSGSLMEIDPATRRSLELVRTQAGERVGSLLHAIDHTVTQAGGRLLYTRLCTPLCDVTAVNARLDDVAAFIAHDDVRADVRAVLKQAPDLERALARITVGRGTPRDLAALQTGLVAASQIFQHLTRTPRDVLPNLKNDLLQNDELQSLATTLAAALSDHLPHLARDGGFIRKGYDAQLDALRTLRDEGRRLIAGLQADYIRDTSIESLKIAHNNILGYYIEVPAKRADSLLIKSAENPYIHRQTMASAVRFTTQKLVELEQDLMSASEKALSLELDHFEKLCAHVTQLAPHINQLARALAACDVAAALAELAVRENYVRPVLTMGHEFDIRSGRHPVVAQALAGTTDSFIPNDCTLECAEKLWLLTGPNMAGKSTFLRQNALIAILAQAGCYVPAQAATIGVVDRVFSRVGASDDLARGRSTFMVEMVETASILHQATDRSLVILDEIGRGTSTFDGLSIAWACVEYLHSVNKSRGIFATHYHELTALQQTLNHLACYSMAVKEWQGKIIFMHTVRKGAADRSYGIHVAELAGLPETVTQRAQIILTTLEKDKAQTRPQADLPLFAAPTPRTAQAPKPHPALGALEALNPDDLTPKQALEALYALKSRLV